MLDILPRSILSKKKKTKTKHKLAEFFSDVQD